MPKLPPALKKESGGTEDPGEGQIQGRKKMQVRNIKVESFLKTGNRETLAIWFGEVTIKLQPAPDICPKRHVKCSLLWDKGTQTLRNLERSW